MNTAVWFNVLLQLVYFVGVVFLFGYIISLINKSFYKFVGRGKAVCYATGLIGTPIHELSHAIMCVVFMHKIDEVKLFHIDRESGTLGYVKHSYNKKNLYQVIGNFFIGTAPIVVGTLVIFLFVKLMLPETFSEIGIYVDEFVAAQSYNDGEKILSVGFNSVVGIVESIFSSIDVGILWWAFMVIALCIALHMNLSSLDIKGSLSALPLLAIVFIILNFTIAYIFEDAYPYYVDFMNMAGSYLASALLLSLVLSLICFAIALLVYLILWLPSRFVK